MISTRVKHNIYNNEMNDNGNILLEMIIYQY